MKKKPNSILIFTSYQATDSSQDEYDPYRGGLEVMKKVARTISVDTLKQNINSFLEDMNTIISDAPQKMGELTLDEIEINTQFDAKGNIGIAEVGVQTAIKFILRKKI